MLFPAGVSAAQSDHLFVCRQLSGSVLFEQETREIALDAGSVVLGMFFSWFQDAYRQGSASRIGSAFGQSPEHGCTPAARAEDRLMSGVMAMLSPLASQKSSISDQLVGNHVRPNRQVACQAP